MNQPLVKSFPRVRAKRARVHAPIYESADLDAGGLDLPQAQETKRSRKDCVICTELGFERDETKPSCESVEYTERECLCAPSSAPQFSSSIVQLTIPFEISAICSVLKCSPEEMSTCEFFLSKSVHIFSLGRRPGAVAAIRSFTPEFFSKSEMYREACLALGATHHWSLCTNAIGVPAKELGHEGAYHFRKAVNYARKTAKKLLQDGLESLTSEERDAICITNLLLYAYSCLDPGACDVALSDDATDLISFCHSICLIQRRIIQSLRTGDSVVIPLTFTSEYAYPIPSNVEYPFVTALKKQLKSYYFEYKPSMTDYRVLDKAIVKLQAVSFLSVKFQYFLPLFRYLGSVGTKEFTFLLNTKHNPIAILIILHYSAMSLFAGCCFLDTDNQWTRYMATAKRHLQNTDRDRIGRMQEAPEGLVDDFSWYESFSWLYHLEQSGFTFKSPMDLEKFGCETMAQRSRTD